MSKQGELEFSVDGVQLGDIPVSNSTEDALVLWEKMARERGIVFYPSTEVRDPLKEALEFMNLVPNNKYGDNYAICARIDEFLRKTEE